MARFWEVDLNLDSELDSPKSVSRLDHLPHTQLWPIASEESRRDGRRRSEEHYTQDRCSEVETEQTGTEHTGGELRWSGIGAMWSYPFLLYNEEHEEGDGPGCVSTHCKDVGVECCP
jgi:hypothetical protein